MIILKDTREKYPWSFEFYGYQHKTIAFKTGDYSVEGLQDIFVVERKRTTGELAINFGVEWPRFERELQRLEKYRYKYIICEFPEEHVLTFPKNSTIPPYRWKKLRMGSKFLRKRIHQIEDDYGVHVIYCDGPEAAEAEFIRLANYVKEQVPDRSI